MKIIYVCEEHNVQFTDPEKAKEHDWEFHTPFKESCLLNGKPSTGLCINKDHYERCQKPNVLGKVIKSNWMCWRDGILVVPRKVVVRKISDGNVKKS